MKNLKSSKLQKGCLKVSKKKKLTLKDMGFPEKKKMNKLVTITLKVEVALEEALRAEAKKEKISFSAYCNEALIVSIMNAHL